MLYTKMAFFCSVPYIELVVEKMKKKFLSLFRKLFTPDLNPLEVTLVLLKDTMKIHGIAYPISTFRTASTQVSQIPVSQPHVAP